MEHQLKPPTQPRQLSEADTKRVNAFKKLITIETEAVNIREMLIKAYINYAGALVSNPNQISHSAEDELYNLSLMIDVLV
ncbi:hypothetical protein [Mucilaginibacter sp.]|uniref:hypothetical protein n=1 Tax=Mucilaginibacter sp. TaxID=1882438 RepID=UPI0025E511C1|nr:hypothetical protein [Mucilaginibacter sp.]